MRGRVIGIGQQSAGDDGAGLAVIEALRQYPEARDLDLVVTDDASDLIVLLECPAPVIVVDAVVGAGPPGQILVVTPASLANAPPSRLSTHGLGVRQAIELSAILSPNLVAREIHIVALCIAEPERAVIGLSPPVRDAAERAARLVLDIVDRRRQSSRASFER